MFLTRIPAFLLVLVLFLQCASDNGSPNPQPAAPAPPNSGGNVSGGFDSKADINIIFVGNSLTYENDLPSLVAGIATMDGVRLGITTITQGNYSLDDHWADGTIQTTLDQNNYDFLIAQQGPSALPESQMLLRESSIRIADECLRHNTRFGLYMVWPALSRDFDRDNCIASYTNAARASSALLCPAGLAWKLAWQKEKNIPFYGPDNFHPGIHGSVLAAMVIYAAVKEKKDFNFIDKSRTTWGGSISDKEFEIMKYAAIEAMKIK
jgi:hypothetical protein